MFLLDCQICRRQLEICKKRCLFFKTKQSTETVLNFIDNDFVTPSKKNYFDNVNPATSQVIAKVAASCDKDVDIAVQAAKRALREWKRVSASERADYLRAIADEIEKRLDEFAETESTDNGKPLALAKMVDIPRACWNFRFFAGR
ncbi:Betaine-aldehyde dehydrogenase, partial [Reticulomyxa filosa]